LSGKSSCVNCEVGKYSATQADNVCTYCEAGKHQDLTGKSICVDFNAGKYSTQGQDSGVFGDFCPRGKYLLSLESRRGNAHKCPSFVEMEEDGGEWPVE
jgi:hypothetical protein